MSDSKLEATATISPAPSGFFYPATLILLIANLYPLMGVMAWGWDAFLLLILYWMETVIVAFWAILRIALSEDGNAGTMTVSGTQKVTAPGAIAAFFTVHAGMFIGVHLLFLWILFSGDWGSRTGGFFGFFRHAIGPEGLWIPLVILFIARGAFAIAEVLPERMPRTSRRATPQSKAAAEKNIDRILLGLYGRIFVMQAVVIFGGWFAITISSMAPLLLLIAGKTLVELFMPGLNRLSASNPPTGVGGRSLLE